MEKTRRNKQAPRYSADELTTALRQVIAEKNHRMGMTDLFYTDRLTLQLVLDTFKFLQNKNNDG